MSLERFIEKGGQKLRLGYTTGSCAAAAAKAAALMLFTGERIPYVRLQTPKGIGLLLEVEEICFEGLTAVSCAIRKDSGDDPDVTNGTLIYARVAYSDTPGIHIDGGEGVGRVTKPGLDQPVGSAAINSTPRRMIAQAVQEAFRIAGPGGGDGGPERRPAAVACLDVTISVPAGRDLAAKTFNPRLGIVGGISILGTTGIVEPMSEQALLDTIRTEINVRAAQGWPILAAAPGNYGKTFFLETYGFSIDTAVTSSNFIRDTVRMAADAGFSRMLFVGHIGKLVKVAGGVPNTHSKYGDRRMEILGEIAGAVLGRRQGMNAEAGGPLSAEPPAGEDTAPPVKCETEAVLARILGELSACVSTDEAIRVLRRCGLADQVLAEMTRRIRTVMQEWAEGRMQVEIIVFSNVFGELGRTPHAREFLEALKHCGPCEAAQEGS